ncbi:hypothetical protein D9758_009344 [Tetrapyrgos nigripes]|uniref:Uncharacterized protein n=1 Tax=Tetrapyrgos nigripes TaxID=182062 RepID=A0A8H5LPK1_9AGAR|nr:hypothetical protein D9758_009344 [Tetrapyrgos nigripes]
MGEKFVTSQPVPARPHSVDNPDTAQDLFIRETGMFHKSMTSQQFKKPRVDRMRFEIKDNLLSILKSHNIDTGNKLPWRSLPNVPRERGYKLQYWPDGIPRPDTQNGIEKAPASQIIAIYEVLNNRDHPLGICRNTWRDELRYGGPFFCLWG